METIPSDVQIYRQMVTRLQKLGYTQTEIDGFVRRPDGMVDDVIDQAMTEIHDGRVQKSLAAGAGQAAAGREGADGGAANQGGAAPGRAGQGESVHASDGGHASRADGGEVVPGSDPGRGEPGMPAGQVSDDQRPAQSSDQLKPAKPSSLARRETERGERGEGEGESDSTVVATECGPTHQANSTVAKRQQTKPETDGKRGTSIVRAHEERQARALAFVEHTANGHTLNEIEAMPGMPTRGTFLRWCVEDPQIGRDYHTALQIRAASYADDIVRDAESAKNCSEAHEVAAIKLVVNTKQWVASRLLPKVYGEKPAEAPVETKHDIKQINERLGHLIQRLASR